METEVEATRTAAEILTQDWSEIQTLVAKRDAHHLQSEHLFLGIHEQIAAINRERKALTTTADEVSTKARRLLEDHRQRVQHRMAELRKGRKGIALPKLDFLDQRGFFFGTGQNELITWLMVEYQQDPRNHRSTRAFFWGMQTPELRARARNKGGGWRMDPLTLDAVTRIATGAMRSQLGYQPFSICLGQYINTNFSPTDFSEIRAFPRELFLDLPLLSDAQVIELHELCSNPTNDYPTQQLE